MLCAKANMVFMQTVQQIVLLIQNSVPVTFVTYPEPMRPSIPVMTHSLDQKVMAKRQRQESAWLRLLEMSKRKYRGNTSL